MNRVNRLNRIVFILAIILISSCGKHLYNGAIVPKKTIKLFNGKDFSPLYTWLEDTGYTDPDGVFTIVNIDGAPAIRISGQHRGGIITKARYTNYKLVGEFRWGTLTWAARKDRARDAGFLLHCQGEDGNYAKTFKAPWMRSIEVNILEGGIGDFLLLNGYGRESDQPLGVPKMTVKVLPGQKDWNPEGTPTEFVGGRHNWIYRDPNWKDVLGFRGAKDIEKPTGQWNTIEVTCTSAGDISVVFNGVKINEGLNASFKEGKILTQSEDAEIYWRRLELQPL
jgi:hypothetical protein